MKPKKCKSCQSEFTPQRIGQKACSPKCAISLVSQENKKAFKRETRKAKEKIKSRMNWMREAQTAFNRFIRIRDDGLPCVSCGKYHNGQYHAGHFYATKARPDIRFNVFNVHKQCSVCNNYLSGNIHEYRQKLIDKIGIDRVDGLTMERKYTHDIEYLKRIKQIFSRRAHLYQRKFR